MNSFNFAAKGIEREIARQIAIYEAGGTVEQETLHFDPGDEDSPPLRSKEEAQDYRYFPEPDLVPVAPPAELVERCAAELGELPGERIERIAATLSFSDADVLVTGGLDRLWSAVVAAGADPQAGGQRARERRSSRPASSPDAVDPPSSRSSSRARAEIPRAAFDEALAQLGDAGFSADPYLAQRTVERRGDARPGDRRGASPRTPARSPQYRAGKEGLIGFFVGQVMKETGGSGRPARRQRAAARAPAAASTPVGPPAPSSHGPAALG